MKDYLEGVIKRKKDEISALLKRQDESENLQEVKDLAKQIDEIKAELAEAEAKLAELIKKEQDKQEDKPADNTDEENNSDKEPRNSFNPLTGTDLRGNASETSTMQYRTAFMNYVQTGKRSEVLKYTSRSDDPSTTSDMGVLLPNTVIQEIIKGLDGVYGQLYDGVKKTNVKGGVQYPIGAFSATFNWVGETDGKPDDEDGGGVTGSITFGYKTGRVRLARTLVAEQMEVAVFEKELSDSIVKSYVKEMDKQILSGTGTNDMTGILTEAAAVSSRIPSSNIISMSASDVADWKKWQEKLFSKIPLGLRGRKAKFVFTPGTWESNIKTLADDNDRPIHTDWYNPATGDEVLKFKGKEVTLIENDLGIEDFDTASADDFFGMLWVPEEAYAINTNLQFAIERYYDRDKLQWIRQAVLIIDGQVLNPAYIYLLKKSGS